MAVSVDIKPLAELLDGGFSKSGIRKAFFRFSYERIILMYYTGVSTLRRMNIQRANSCPTRVRQYA